MKTAKKKYVAHLEAVQLDRVMDREEVAHHIVDSAVAIHTALGPGLLESLYRSCLMVELGLRGLDVCAEYPFLSATKRSCSIVDIGPISW